VPSSKLLTRRYRAHIDEYLVIVGAPSNTFNGYFHVSVDPNTSKPTFYPETPPADSSVAEVGHYIGGNPPRAAPDNTTTHDLYWANFAYAAVKLIQTGIVRPQAGDILTFIIYWPGYELRAKKDWDASPYNMLLHRYSPWVAGKKPYDSTTRAADQASDVPPRPLALPPNKTTTTTVPAGSPLEEKINHEILMRTTGEIDPPTQISQPDGGFHKRAHNPIDYFDSILGIPWRIGLGLEAGRYPPGPDAPPLSKVFIKLLFLREVLELREYLVQGTWTGKRYLHIMETETEEDIGNMIPISEATWYGRVFPVPKVPHPEWLLAPAVNRASVKLKRLDYFGHSNASSLFLRYGWANKKGEEPNAEVFVTKDDLDAWLTPGLFAEESIAQLWGCSLADEMAPVLSSYINRVRATSGFTSYDPILDALNPFRMPEPTAPWQDWP
jgi:hypothetical protein